jgi:predicted DNA-binding mobile mystery protein A
MSSRLRKPQCYKAGGCCRLGGKPGCLKHSPEFLESTKRRIEGTLCLQTGARHPRQSYKHIKTCLNISLCKSSIALFDKKQSKHVIKDKIRRIILEDLESKAPVLADARSAATVPARGWLRAVREAVGLTQLDVASKVGIKRQSYAQLENAEERASISIASLRRAAEAMDCELMYCVIPREASARSYARLAQVHDPMSRHQSATDQSMRLEGQAGSDEIR